MLSEGKVQFMDDSRRMIENERAEENQNIAVKVRERGRRIYSYLLFECSPDNTDESVLIPSNKKYINCRRSKVS